MTATTHWREYSRALAHEVGESGVIRHPAWESALTKIPRHLFVPRFYEQQSDGTWTSMSDDETWLEQVYRNEALITELTETSNGQQEIVSSSTKPGLMIRMLETLDVDDGHRVLEIGTGTGYNAALLCFRLGDKSVYSTDIDAELVNAARDRLAEVGYRPTLVAGDGAEGIPDHAPFDRIIATCSVPAIPETWRRQLREGGLILADLKPSVHAGNLVLLRRTGDQLEGRFLTQWAGFMSIRSERQPAVATSLSDDAGTASITRLDPFPWSSLVPWFLAQAYGPGDLGFSLTGRTDAGDWECTRLTAPDGSWVTVRIAPDDSGAREVRQGGPTRLWDALESAHQQWTDLGAPTWDRFGLTITPDGIHTIWLDAPNSQHRWQLHPN